MSNLKLARWMAAALAAGGLLAFALAYAIRGVPLGREVLAGGGTALVYSLSGLLIKRRSNRLESTLFMLRLVFSGLRTVALVGFMIVVWKVTSLDRLGFTLAVFSPYFFLMMVELWVYYQEGR